ncbi:Holliday junction branch migration protein RuvA [Romeria aff. gracilis LEGE 07310]|uniref:Holliday junction branch migration complex subunit RuvA n=1 Tax=Vasconcelosia minhoensis LEGE 07310 TaxID=915328 RepID=A0A8J7AYN2_9CYAN|nr:Holliday junction branch migration protein RuvA [Romeria gracilis]MBE9078717.1 Holliday junction branch migration protein RuvA [Romeria aff. gracilis LEGE 07310]
MIGYLRGSLADIQKLPNGRVILTLDVQQVGYDIQVNPRLLSQLPPLGDPTQIYTHLQTREDQTVLFGFGSRAERDAFRLLISVSGIGPQMGMALLDTLGLQDLIQAVVSANTRLLSRTPGVGGKTAERIILELKTKLGEWRQQSGLIAPTGGPATVVQEEVEMTLLALGYSNSEISKALQAVGRSTTLSKTADTEAWIREAITWLSQ